MGLDNLEALVPLGQILLVLLWASTVLWTYKDAKRRIDDPILIVTAVVMSLVLPVIGIVVYMMLRPPEYLADVRERELEILAMERTLGRQERCPECKSHIEGDFLACPICSKKLRTSCRTCDRPLDPLWSLCPYCETEVPGARRGYDPTPPSRRKREEPRERAPKPSSPVRSKGAYSASNKEAAKSAKPNTPVKSDEKKSGDTAETRQTPKSTPSRSKPAKTPSPKSPVKLEDNGTDIKTEPFSRFAATELQTPVQRPLTTTPTNLGGTPLRGDNF